MPAALPPGHRSHVFLCSLQLYCIMVMAVLIPYLEMAVTIPSPSWDRTGIRPSVRTSDLQLSMAFTLYGDARLPDSLSHCNA